MDGNNSERPNIDPEDNRLADVYHKIAEEKQTNRDPEERDNATEEKE